MIAAVAAVWVSLAVDGLARGLMGVLFGVPIGDISVSARDLYALHVAHGSLDALGPWSFAGVLVAGTVSVIGGALALYTAASALRSPGWLRGFSLAWLVVALVWIPGALAAATVPGGAGPAAELYGRLGGPQAGRRAVAALALVVLALAAGPVSERAVATGRAWMRADGLGFRRRLVRVTAGWPGAAAALALGMGAGWAGNPWLLVVPAAVLGALHFRTR